MLVGEPLVQQADGKADEHLREALEPVVRDLHRPQIGWPIVALWRREASAATRP